MLTVTGLSGINVLSVTCNIVTSDTHTVSIQAIGDLTSIPVVGTAISVYEGNALLLNARIDTVDVDYTTQNINISAIDYVSWASKYTSPITSNIAVDQSINIQSMLSLMTRIPVTAPSISCYGGGTQTLSIDSALSDVASAFGLLYTHGIGANPSATLAPAGLGQKTGNNSPCLSVSQGDSYSDHISKIYIQREPAQATKDLLTITNQGASSSTNVRLQNPNAQYEEHDGVEYPIKFPSDYWIDPWSKQFCTITVPVSTSVYHTAYDCGEEGYTKVVYHQCNDKNRNWKLALYASDPGTDLSHPIVQPIIRLSPGGSYSGGQITKYMRIEQYTNNQILCPDTGGVQIKAYVWSGEDYDIPGWVRSFLSGDTGRVDYNSITSPYYPNENTFVSSGIGERIARQDSTTCHLDIVKPGIVLAQSNLTGVGTTVDNISLQSTAYSLSYIETLTNRETHIEGEH